MAPLEHREKVAILRWPTERRAVEQLARHRRPRLLIVEAAARPPRSTDPLQDWTYFEPDSEGAQARLAVLRDRYAEHLSRSQATGSAHAHRRSLDLPAELSETELRLIRRLDEQRGVVVTRPALIDAAWPTQPVTRDRLDSAMRRLRRRLATAPVRITTVRGRGYVLQVED